MLTEQYNTVKDVWQVSSHKPWVIIECPNITLISAIKEYGRVGVTLLNVALIDEVAHLIGLRISIVGGEMIDTDG